jgi:hypothetical protein
MAKHTNQFDPKGKFYVAALPVVYTWSSEEAKNGTELPSDWFATYAEAEAAAKANAENNSDRDPYGVFQPMVSYVAVPPDVTTVALI